MISIEFLRYMAISQSVLLALSALIFHRKTYIGILLSLFGICMTCYLAFPLFDFSQNKTASFLIGRLAFATPAVLWLIAYAFFIDRGKIPIAVWVCIGAYMVLRAIGSIYFYVAPEHPRISAEFFIFYLIPAALRLGMCAHMIFLALSGYENDLIEVRRRIRAPVVLILGGLFALMAISSAVDLARQMSEDFLVSPAALESIISLFIFPAALTVNILLFKIDFDKFQFTLPQEKHSSTRVAHPELDAKDLSIKAKILNSMDKEKIYTRSGLTIGEFAKYLDIQEYKLRHIINHHLNHSNFSHFLNSYRIHEAEHKLMTTNDSVFNIGLDVGYTSLSSFHKAFKETHGVTPKEFRILNRRVSTPGAALPS